jgi:hypothetical protein
MRDCQFASADNDMRIPFFTQCRVSGPPIRAHATSRRNIALNKAAEILSAEILSRRIGNTLKTDSADTPSCLALIPFVLNPYNNQSLALGPSSTFSGLHTTDVCLIRRDQIGQGIPSRPHHGPAQSMQPSLSCVVTTQSQYTLEAQSVRSELLFGDVPHGLKPHFLGLSSLMKQRPRRNRDLSPALSARMANEELRGIPGMPPRL